MSMLTALALLAPAAMPPAPATLWTSGHGFPCYRQPVVVSAGGSRLLAFVEGRFSSPCAPAATLGADAHHPNEVGGLNLRISEDGQNWGPSKIIYGNATEEGPNMDYFSVVRHSATNTIHLFLAVSKGIQHFTSKDGGESWQGPTELAGPNPWPHAPTVGHGVELASGALVVPACCSAGSCALISADAGKTWSVGGFGAKGSRESSIAEVDCGALVQRGTADHGAAPPSCLYMNARNMNKNAGTAHGRFEAGSTNGGVSWTNMTLSTVLTTPVTPHWTGIVANVVALPAPASAGSLVYAGASAPTARARMALSVSSSGEGQAIKWSPPKTIWPGPAGYADIVAINSTHVGVLYEAGDTTFADRIQFSVVPTSFIA